MDTLLTGLKPEEWHTLCYHPSRPLTVRDLVNLRLTEVAMHGWDIRASFDPQASLSEAGVRALVLHHPACGQNGYFVQTPNVPEPCGTVCT